MTVPEALEQAVPEGFRVHLPVYDGPFDLLLGLVAKHRLDITEVALAQVTDEFLAYLRSREREGDLDEVTSFLVVAATLLDLKTARLLPSRAEPDDEDLALLEARDLLFARLLQYRAYRTAGQLLGALLAHGSRRWASGVRPERELLDAAPPPPLRLTAAELARAAVRAMTPRPIPLVAVDHVHAPRVSVREHLVRLREQLVLLGAASFTALCEDCTETIEVVARFLALLELFREGRVGVDQAAPFGDLRVRWLPTPVAAGPVAADGYGDEPSDDAGPAAGSKTGDAGGATEESAVEPAVEVRV